MPKYFFNIRGPANYIEDVCGVELPDIAAAQHEASASACDVLRCAIRSRRTFGRNSIEVTDAAGQVLFIYPVKSISLV